MLLKLRVGVRSQKPVQHDS